MAPIPVCHSGKRNRSNGSCQIHLDHAAVDDKHDTDGKGVHGKPHEKGLEPQPEQFSRAQGFKLRLHIRDDAADINGGIPDDDACAAVHNALPHIEDTHDDIPCVRHNENGTESLENPLEEHPGIYIVQIVFLCHKLDQLITHYECQDNPGDWNDHRFREVSDHRKDAAVPCQRRLSHFTGDLAYFGIDRIEHARQVSRDSLDEQPSEPFIEFVEYAAHKRSPPDDQPNRPESRGTRVMPMRATPPPAINCFIPWLLEAGLS